MEKEDNIKTILSNFIISILISFLYLLILGWNNYFNIGLKLNRYGNVNFGEYFFTALIAVLIPLLIIGYFDFKKKSSYKYIALIAYLLVIYSGTFITPFFGGIFKTYLYLIIPFIIIIDLLTISKKYLNRYKKIIPFATLLIILILTFSIIYFSSPKSVLGYCPKEDKNCIDLSNAEKAFEENNINLCYSSPISDRCLSMLGTISHDSSICEKIPLKEEGMASTFRDSCYSDTYSSECMLKSTDTEKAECAKQLCEKVTSDSVKRSCLENIDFYIDEYNKYGWRN